ncbi:ATP-binding protein [Jatrophihabitans cynanchi]|uniref:ATP-binding protein n=1 Tax=Jatrophihabitans cynanchi TaxID=2944128 RepID=A0ABY7JS05_9ACTN|nr:ATP-binding protein [Jatrophihabitans sp. SB3-54]WAX55128.1 ATP-binding protein [Jatrophihabitans sp. SB3-54]
MPVAPPRPTREPVAGARRIAAPAYVPAGTGRQARRAARRNVRRVEAGARVAESSARKAARDADRAERQAAHCLPRAGEDGSDSLRVYRPLKIQQHRATSEVLAGAYPFLAEAGLGEKGVYVGTDSYSGAAFCFDPWVLYADGVLTNPNVLLAGIIGRGKSSLAKSLATRSIAFGRKVYVPGDPKGEWTPVAEAVGGQAIQLGGGLSTRLNPLDEGPRPAALSEAEWINTVTGRRRDLLRAIVEMSLARPMHSVEATAVFTALDAAVRENTTPTLRHVVEAMFNPSHAVAGSSIDQLTADGRAVAHALNRLVTGDLSGLFDGPSTTHFHTDLPMVSLDLSRIHGSDQLIALVMTCASTWMEAAITDPDSGQRWVIYDEAWRLLRSPALLARMQSQWKLSRAWGIANLMIIHRLSDLDAVGDANSAVRNLALGLLADCSTRIIYAQEAGESTKTGAAIGLAAAEIAQLPDLERGEGLWKIKDRAFLARNVLTPGELAVFDTNSRMDGPAARRPAGPSPC